MQIEIDRPVLWTSTDNDGETIEYMGILKAATDTHYTISFPDMGEIEVPQDDGEFTPVTDETYQSAIEEEVEEEVVEVKPKKAKVSRSDKMYSVVGFATDDRGNAKVRFTNDMKGRLKAFKRAGWTDVRLAEFGDATKRQLVEQLAEHDDFQDEAAQTMIQEWLDNNG